MTNIHEQIKSLEDELYMIPTDHQSIAQCLDRLSIMVRFHANVKMELISMWERLIDFDEALGPLSEALAMEPRQRFFTGDMWIISGMLG